MSVIIYGVRPYGRVDAHGGEHAQTSFFHLWFVPLIPTSSFWVTHETVDGAAGYSIDMHGKSVLAGYIRMWGPVAAIGTMIAGLTGSPLFLGFSLFAIALTVWSWTWRNLRGEAALRRSDFNLVAFGTRCDPKHLPDELRIAFKRNLDDRWNELKPDRTPNEIARHGTKNANEAIVAYGLLRLAAVMRGRAGKDEDADADRILAGAHTALAVGEGPYREGVQAAPATGSLASVVSAMAVAQGALTGMSREARAEQLARQKRRSRWQLVGLVAATLFALPAGIMLFVESVRPINEVTLAELRSSHPPLEHSVRVTCDAVEEPIWEEVDSRGNPTHRIAMCVMGKYLLPLRLEVEEPMPTSTFEGKLRAVSENLLWVRDGLRHEPVLDARSLDVYMDDTDPGERIFIGIVGLALALAIPVLWGLWFRARRRRKAELAAL
jgi:hypothetical protein